MSASTRNLPLQETIHLCNPVRPNLSHALQTHNIPSHSGLTWPIPCILIPLRRCVKHGRVQWVGVLDVNVACGPKTKRNAFPRVPWAKCSLCKSCKDKAAKAEFKIQPVTLPTPSFTDLILFTTGTTRSQWADSERTLNVHWTCSERGIEHWENWGKERIGGNRKKIQYLCFFLKITINCTDLLLFAAFWTVFNVCSMLRSLYVHCMFNVSFHQKLTLTRDHTPV